MTDPRTARPEGPGRTLVEQHSGALVFVEKPFSNNARVDRIELALAASAGW